MQAEGPLQYVFKLIRTRLLIILRLGWLLLMHQPGDGLAAETGLMLQITTGDLLTLGVVGQPAASFRQQLLELGVADEVVLGIVENGYEDVKMRQQVRQRCQLPDCHPEVRAFAPLGKPVVERMPQHFDLIAEGFENAPQEALAPAHWDDIDPRRPAEARW